MSTERKIPPPHPGGILQREFLEPLEMSQSELARRMDVDKRRVNDLVHEKRGVTVDTAVRLAAVFGTSLDFWLNLQKLYDVETSGKRLEEARQTLRPVETAKRPPKTSTK